MKPSVLLSAWRETYPRTIDDNDSARLAYAVLHFLDRLEKDAPPSGLISPEACYARELVALDRITNLSRIEPAAVLAEPGPGDTASPFRIWRDRTDALVPASVIRARFERVFGDPDVVRPTDPPTDAGNVEDRLAAAVRLVHDTMGELGADLLDQVDQVAFVAGSKPFLAGTTLGIPRTIFLNPSLLRNAARLAEHLLHEAVHTALYKSYFERTPLRRFSAARAEYGYVSAVWHDPDLTDPDDPWWWGAEKAFHAFVVYVHLAHFHLGLLRHGGHDEIARAGLRTSLFCGHFLGSRLVDDLPDLFVGRVQHFIRSLLETLPTSGGLIEAAQKYQNKGVRRTTREATAQPAGPAADARPRYAAGFLDRDRTRLFVMTDETAFVLGGEWARALARPPRHRSEADDSTFRLALNFVHNPAIAARPLRPDVQDRIDDCVEVDGVTLRHMAMA